MRKLLVPAALLLCLGLMPFAGAQDKKENKEEPKYANLTYVPTADEVIDKMFEMAKVGKNDVLFDLGCGDARILYKAAKKYGSRGVGLEINPDGTAWTPVAVARAPLARARSPLEVAEEPLAIARQPPAVALLPSACASAPVAVAFAPLARALEPADVALAPAALARAPVAVALAPVASD